MKLLTPKEKRLLSGRRQLDLNYERKARLLFWTLTAPLVAIFAALVVTTFV
jgi:hypothetical protein